MENIVLLFEAAGILLLVCLCIAVLLYPIMFEITFRQQIGTPGISLWWTICQIIVFFSTMSYVSDTSSEEFCEALVFSIIVFIIAIVRNYKRIKKKGCDKKVCIAGALAQMMAPFGIIFVLVVISSLFDKNSKDND